jgi:tetratricopeptide (TPR) repeat protein
MRNILLTLALLVLFSSCNKNKEKSDFFFKSALAKKENKDFFGALTDYNKAIEFDPESATSYHNRGLVKNDLKDYTGAISDLNKSIQLQPNQTKAYINRGLVYSRSLKDYNKAIADFTKAIEVKPFLPFAYFYMGVSRYNLGDYDVAIIAWSKAIDQSWLQDDVEFLMKNGIPIPTFNDIYARGGLLIRSYYLRGKTYLRKGMVNDACEDFNKLSTTPNFVSSSPLFLSPDESSFLDRNVQLCN